MSDQPLINNTQSFASEEFLATHPWVQHYQEGVPAHVVIPDHSLVWLLDQAANCYPKHTALIYYGTKISYARLSELANRFAVKLQQLGLQKGDRVAIALPNIPQYPIAFYGALRAGAVVVPTNPLYTGREIQHQLADSGARVLIMLDTFYPVVRAIRKQTALEHIIFANPADFLPPLLHLLYPLSQRGATVPQNALTGKEFRADLTLQAMPAILKERHSDYHLPAPADSDELAVLQYTGGTTGLSKGAMLTHRNLLANAIQNASWMPKGRPGQEIGLCVAPFFHSYGLTVGMNLSIYLGAAMVLLPRFKAKDVVAAIKRYHPTTFPGIPTMYIAIMQAAGQHVDYMRSIHYCISGASPLPAKVQTDFEKMTGGKLVEGYGLSEASPVTHCNPLTDENRNGSIGLPIPSIEAAILDRATGNMLPPDEIGEIVVKGPNIMQGYWNRTEETQQTFVDGWMLTGDIGKMDQDGYFYVVDRSKDLILVSGFNVYPREVEEVLFMHPAIAEAAVTGVPHEYRGETVGAFVVLKPGISPSDETRASILKFCQENLTAYKVPKILEFRADLPKTLVGKVLRRALRATQPSSQ